MSRKKREEKPKKKEEEEWWSLSKPPGNRELGDKLMGKDKKKETE